VIYFDQKGVLRKEKSWNSWRHSEINPLDLENVPTSGFVLNKGVGGQRHSYGWNARNEYIRVYDPRDFEFEISVANLLFILRECDCSKGKGLEGEFVYAWDGTELVLLPVISTDYGNSTEFTVLQSGKVIAADMVLGATYTTKDQRSLIYLGRFVFHNPEHSYRKKKVGTPAKKYVFYGDKGFVYLDDLKTISRLTSEDITPDYAGLVESYNKGVHGSKVVRLFTEENTTSRERGRCEFVYQKEKSFIHCYSYNDCKPLDNYHVICKHTLTDKGLIREDYSGTPYRNEPVHSYSYTRGIQPIPSESIPWVEPTNLSLFAELESGTIFEVGTYNLKERAESHVS
jgi:hypothetical protein